MSGTIDEATRAHIRDVTTVGGSRLKLVYKPRDMTNMPWRTLAGVTHQLAKPGPLHAGIQNVDTDVKGTNHSVGTVNQGTYVSNRGERLGIIVDAKTWHDFASGAKELSESVTALRSLPGERRIQLTRISDAILRLRGAVSHMGMDKIRLQQAVVLSASACMVLVQNHQNTVHQYRVMHFTNKGLQAEPLIFIKEARQSLIASCTNSSSQYMNTNHDPTNEVHRLIEELGHIINALSQAPAGSQFKNETEYRAGPKALGWFHVRPMHASHIINRIRESLHEPVVPLDMNAIMDTEVALMQHGQMLVSSTGKCNVPENCWSGLIRDEEFVQNAMKGEVHATVLYQMQRATPNRPLMRHHIYISNIDRLHAAHVNREPGSHTIRLRMVRTLTLDFFESKIYKPGDRTRPLVKIIDWSGDMVPSNTRITLAEAADNVFWLFTRDSMQVPVNGESIWHVKAIVIPENSHFLWSQPVIKRNLLIGADMKMFSEEI